MAARGPVIDATGLRADAARNRALVLQVARQKVDSGDLSLQMNAIAKQAGVGVGTVYRHFPTRQSLLEAVATEGFAALVEEARSAAAAAEPAEGLRRLLRRALQLLVENPGLAAVLASPQFECIETLDLGAELGAAVGSILTRARLAGDIRPDVTEDDIRRLMVGLRLALVSGPAWRKRLEVYLDVFLSGLRPFEGSPALRRGGRRGSRLSAPSGSR
jgi:AcrR family transcriptional regulator